MFNNIPENKSRSPPHHPRDPLQNDDRPLPLGWERRISDNVHPGRVYYTNGRQSKWHFPNQEQNPNFVITEPEPPAYIQRAEAEYQARIELAQAEERQAQRQALIERRALIQRAEAEYQAHIELAQAVERLNLREHLELITNNNDLNNDFDEYNIGVLYTLRQFILRDNIEPMNPWSVRDYISDLNHLIRMIKDPDIHSDLKRLCEKIFEEMYEKLAKEKKLIDDGLTTHDEADTANLIRQLDGLNYIYNRFMNAINNIS
jgi:uncharacterized protein YpiB (UPF0302 family)